MPNSSFSKLLTEQRNPDTVDIDLKSTLEIVDIINEEDAKVIAAVRAERENIARAIDIVVNAFRGGGRLFYVGAGTSGRLGVLDASECPPTYGVTRDLVQGIIAGGEEALVRSIEGAEDNPEDGADAIDERGVTAKDVVMGIATSGTTPFVRGALIRAKELGARTIFLTCNPKASLPPVEVDVLIQPLTGPEVVAGSTRMKGGTATKLVLNTLTTGAMIKIGKVYENLMVDLRAVNQKLRDRAQRIISTVTGLDKDASQQLLERANGHVKTALVMQKLNVDCAEANRLLDKHDGFVRKVLL